MLPQINRLAAVTLTKHDAARSTLTARVPSGRKDHSAPPKGAQSLPSTRQGIGGAPVSIPECTLRAPRHHMMDNKWGHPNQCSSLTTRRNLAGATM